jgi:hypothetical protein
VVKWGYGRGQPASTGERGERNVDEIRAALEAAEVHDAWSEYETDLLDPRSDDSDTEEEDEDA